MKKINLIGCLSMALTFLFISCSEDATFTDFEKKGKVKLPQETTLITNQNDASCSDVMTYPLIAGQHINVGTVTVSNNDDTLFVTYNTTGDWFLTETHLFVGADSDIPYSGGGNPQFGHFPYHGDHGSVQSFTFAVSLADLDDCFSVVPHAAVDKIVNGQAVQGETAFGCGDKEFPGNRWGCYFEYCKQECNDDNCMEVFARKYDEEHVSCLDVPVNGNSLSGWSSEYPYRILFNSNKHDLDIYMKNDCDITNVAYFGRVEVIKDATNDANLKVKYVIHPNEYGGANPGNIHNYKLSEIMFYIGPEENPYNVDGSYKTGITGANFYSEVFDIPVQATGLIDMTWTGDTNPDTNVYIIPYAKVCKEVED
tara:strand:- start:190302 stop:191405 length:1104 start_codon:yes stop_codon:yes gene_type:complete